MTVLVPSVCMALLAGFLAVVVYPVLTSRHAWRRQTGTVRLRLELTERKEQLYASIKELEFDRSLAKISQEDYEELRSGLETEALEVLRQLDSLDGHVQATAALTARIEADVATLRPLAEPAGQSPAADPAASPFAFCPGCGERRQPRHRFCPHCGESLDDPADAS